MELQAAAASFLQCCMGQENFDHYSKIKDHMQFSSHISFFTWLLSTADSFILLKKRHLYQKALAASGRDTLLPSTNTKTPTTFTLPPSVQPSDDKDTAGGLYGFPLPPPISLIPPQTISSLLIPPPSISTSANLLMPAVRPPQEDQDEPQDFSMAASRKRKQAKPRQVTESEIAALINNNNLVHGLKPTSAERFDYEDTDEELVIDLPLQSSSSYSPVSVGDSSPDRLSDVVGSINGMLGDEQAPSIKSTGTTSPGSSLSESTMMLPPTLSDRGWPLSFPPSSLSGLGGELDLSQLPKSTAPSTGMKKVKKEDPGCSCHICGRYIKYRRNFKAHMLEVHTNLSKSTCPICQRAYTRPSTLRYHLKVVHRCEHPKMYVCRDCGKVFWKRSTLHSHQQLDHRNVVSLTNSNVNTMDTGSLAGSIGSCSPESQNIVGESNLLL